MPRVTDLGISIGFLPSGPTNSVLDVAGVGVGHATVWRDEPDPPTGRGVARTGVTVVRLRDDPFHEMLPAGGAVLNGAGECTGFITAREWGTLETPVFLTSTLQLGRVYDAACELMLERWPDVAEDFIIPVVGECDDSFLNDARRMQVTRDDVQAAWEAADASVGSSTPPAEGAVGSGTGMSCLGFKGGIGTASRITGDGATVGVLLMTNFGTRDQLTVSGVPVGRLLGPPPDSAGSADRQSTRPAEGKPPAGSCIGLVVTDAAVDGAGCARLARRVGLGLARAGSVAHHGSGEIFMATSTGARVRRDDRTWDTPVVTGRGFDPLFAAVVEASEEAVLNSIFASPTVVGRAGNTATGIPVDDVVRLWREHGRVDG
ncbi:MAG: P1 family peptidase [Nocardioidaceae bacterium]